MDEWFNAVQTQIDLCNYPSETASILQRDIFWFYLRDEEFISKTLNEGCADLQQYPASKVRQLAKKLESSKATARHIKQATSNAQAAQINLLCHQCTELAQKKKKGHKCKQHFKPKQGKPPYKKLIHHRPMAVRITVPNVVIPGMHKAFPVQQRNIYARHVRNMDTLQAYAFQSRRNLHIRSQLRR